MKSIVRWARLPVVLIALMTFSSVGAEENIVQAPVPEEMNDVKIPTPSKNAKPMQSNLMKTTGKLFVRSGPGKMNKSISILRKGRSVSVLKEENGWYKIRFGKKEGWVSGKYLKK
jgi:uncharacterized protein YgiM (DUF1202 family)